MPITDVPPSPPSSSPPPPPAPSPGMPPRPPELSGKRRKRGNYEDLEAHELLLVIDDLEDERSRLRRREGIWVSVLAHIVIFAIIALLPRFIPQVHVVMPSDTVSEEKKDMTMLSLPPSVLKGLREAPRTNAPAPRPTPETKALEAPAAPKPVEPPPRPQPTPPPQLQQQPVPQPKLPLPSLPPNPHSQLDVPRATPTKPSFATDTAPGDAVRQAARDAARSGLQSGGGAPGLPGRGRSAGLQGGAQVLSDTGGWDYGPYIRRIVFDTEQAWYPIIPEEVRAPLLKKGIVGIRFKIMRDGSVQGMVLEGRSGDVALDKAAWGGITGASPYPPLPPEFKGPYLELRFGFFYNQDPGVQ